jgi:hypothetical protein
MTALGSIFHALLAGIFARFRLARLIRVRRIGRSGLSAIE